MDRKSSRGVVSAIKALMPGLIVCLALAAAHPCRADQTAAPHKGDSAIDTQDILFTIQDLAAFPTRHALSADVEDAAVYLEKRLRDMGCTVLVDQFTFQGASMRNVIGVLPSSKQGAERILILGAHYDSINENGDGPEAPAPGADDNASGVAATLAAAADLARTPQNAEVRVVFFTAEEIGMHGSRHYVNDVLAGDTRPVAALITDYIGTDTGADGVMLLYDKRSTGLMRTTIGDVAARRQPDLHVWPMRSDMLKTFGDYKAFWDAGRPAVMLVREFKPGVTEYDHTPADTPDKLRVSQVVKVARLLYDTVLALAGD